MKKNYYGYNSSSLPLYQSVDFGIKSRELREIFFPLENLVLKLKAKFISGKYALTIGDDASGRLPALILNHVQNMCSKDKKTPIFFLAGSRRTKTIEAKKTEIKRFVEKRLNVPKGKSVLIVTEFIHRGDSLSLLTDVLSSLNIDYDVCTIGVCRSKSLSSLSRKLGIKILFGIKGKPSIDGNYTLAGVEKSYEDLLARRYKMTEAERVIFCEGRKDVHRIAEVLFKKVF